MFKISVVLVFVAVLTSTLVLSEDYKNLFDSVEELTTSFDEIVRTTTVRATRPRKATNKKISRTTTTESYNNRKVNDDYSGEDEEIDVLPTLRTTARPKTTIRPKTTARPTSPASEKRAIWEHGQV